MIETTGIIHLTTTEEMTNISKMRLTDTANKLAPLLYSSMKLEDIAATMGISNGMAMIYASRIYEAFGVSSRVELMAKKIEVLQK